jgi:hypothetical protein
VTSNLKNIINNAEERNNLRRSKKFVCRSKCTKVEATRVEADKCKLHPKLFHWPQASMWPKSEQEISKFVSWKRKTRVLVACETINHKAWEPAESHIT